MRLVTTTASCATETARTGRGRLDGSSHSDHLQQLGGVAEGLDLRGGLLLALFELLTVAIDPDHRDLGLQARLHVGRIAAGDVHPVALLLPDPRAHSLKCAGSGL